MPRPGTLSTNLSATHTVLAASRRARRAARSDRQTTAVSGAIGASGAFGIRGALSILLTLGAFLALFPFSGPVAAGPFRDGRLFPHVNPAVPYTLGDTPTGMPGNPTCENATTRIEITDEPVLWYITAAFPHRREPSLEWVSFGIEYDEDRLEIIDSRFAGEAVETSSDWPSSGSGVRCTWSHDTVGNSIEVGWFVGYLRSEDPTSFRLVPGRDGGYFGDFIYHEAIDGYGELGFGIDGDLTCPPLETRPRPRCHRSVEICTFDARPGTLRDDQETSWQMSSLSFESSAS